MSFVFFFFLHIPNFMHCLFCVELSAQIVFPCTFIHPWTEIQNDCLQSSKINWDTLKKRINLFQELFSARVTVIAQFTMRNVLVSFFFYNPPLNCNLVMFHLNYVMSIVYSMKKIQFNFYTMIVSLLSALYVLMYYIIMHLIYVSKCSPLWNLLSLNLYVDSRLLWRFYWSGDDKYFKFP